MTTVPNVSDDMFEGIGDPDAPVDDRGFVGDLTVTAYVDMSRGAIIPSYGSETDTRILATCTKYFEKFGYAYGAWYIEAEAKSIVRDDGLPFRAHEILKMQSKEGKALGSNQAHAVVAKGYVDLGLSGSFRQIGQPNSALGKTFEFGSHVIGKGTYAKTVSLFPKQLVDEFNPADWPDYCPNGEPRVIKPKAGSDGAPVDGGTSNAISEAEAIVILKETLTGVTPANMLDAILGEPRLQSVASVFGTPLIDGATDESLVSVLQENRAMALSGTGVLVAV